MEPLTRDETLALAAYLETYSLEHLVLSTRRRHDVMLSFEDRERIVCMVFDALKALREPTTHTQGQESGG